ncbi:hypothetical protein K491DRAFT_763763 [Lophiostoma macrostomum CBS 122681]|uniref:Hydantoinase B/oxoprolinase domain-containing protein n=1 Tax=Lophiostoma macrostomum CBS 122681 TaxID=1314788 RepID=A0A6A6SI83_9PLEO|nr:hypothetical protein K491DRAFT_763763 [Lophiostoma macrostomum CBS 122681]
MTAMDEGSGSDLRDLLEIGYQSRPRKFDLNIVKPEMLNSEVQDVEQRITVDGFAVDVFGVHKATEEIPSVPTRGSSGDMIKILTPLNEQSMVPRGSSASANAYHTPEIMKYLKGFVKGSESGHSDDVKTDFMRSDSGLVGHKNPVSPSPLLVMCRLANHAQEAWKKFCPAFPRIPSRSLISTRAAPRQMYLATVHNETSTQLLLKATRSSRGVMGFLLLVRKALGTEAVSKKFEKLADVINPETGKSMSPEEVAPGFLDVLAATSKTHFSNRSGAAVCAGNTQTSRRVVDVVLKTFGAAAGSHGLTNTDGTEHSYAVGETICGGSGATAIAHGASAVHTRKINTRMTDPETLERRYPVILREFAVHQSSGDIQCRAPIRFSVITEPRAVAPYGMHGGTGGAKGVTYWAKRVEKENGEGYEERWVNMEPKNMWRWMGKCGRKGSRRLGDECAGRVQLVDLNEEFFCVHPYFIIEHYSRGPSELSGTMGVH